MAQIIDGGASRSDPLRARTGLLAAALALVFAVLAAGLLMPGVLQVAAMEHDVLHLMDAVARREAGQLAHLDFITPLGDLSIEAIAIWRRVFDLPFGMSMLMANVTVMAATLPLAIWAGASRLGFWPGLALGVYCLLLAASLSWQVGGVSITFAMSYNRWAWALAIPMIVLLLTRPRHPGARTDLIDGLAIGLTAAALAWLKASYAAALLPAFVAWALMMGRMRAALIALAVGIAAFAGFAVALAGDAAAAVALIEAYVRDLIFVAGSAIRPAPGAAPMQLIAAPEQALGTMLCVVAAVILLAARLRAEAAVWLIAFAGTVVIAWQNFGNEMLGLMAFAAAFPALGVAVARAAPDLLVAGRPAAKVLGWFAAAMLVIGMQHALVLQRSVFAGWRVGPSALHTPLADVGAPDMAFSQSWSGVVGRMELVEMDLAITDELTARQRQMLTFRGAREIDAEAFPGCSIGSGWDQTWRELNAIWRARPDLSGRTVIQADTINYAWLLLGAPPQKNAPIWHYDDLGPALTGAELLLVPRCPVARRNRNMILDEAAAAGLTLRLVLSTEMWAAYEIGAPD